jgi:conjugal transfer/entry exclusion protein
MINGGLWRATTLVNELLNLPRVPLLIVDQARVIVAFVEEFQDRREYLGFFVGECDPLVVGVRHVSCQDTVEEGRYT